MKKETKQGLAIVGGLVGTGLAAYQLLKPTKPPKPEEGLSTLWGMITDSISKNPIQGIEALLGSSSNLSDSSGRYELRNMDPGTYLLTFTDPQNRYEEFPEFTIELEPDDIKQKNITLTASGEYPEYVEYVEEGIRIRKLEVSSPAIAGYPVTISCWALSNRTQTKTFTLYINGTEVDSQTIRFTTTFLWDTKKVELEYTPASAGIYDICVALSPYEEGLVGSFEATAPVFTNTPLELVKDAVNEFADVLAGLDLSGSGSLKDAYFTFDPTVVQPDLEPYDPGMFPSCREGYHREQQTYGWLCVPNIIPNATLNCTIKLSIPSGWTLGARLIAVKASEYESWLSGIGFMKWGRQGRLGQGIYGLGFPKIIELPTGATRTVGSTCGDYPDCHNIYDREICGGWEGCTLRSGDHEFNVNGLLDLEPGSWVVLASFVLSVCYIFMSPGPHGTTKRTVLPVQCHNYKIYRIGTIDF